MTTPTFIQTQNTILAYYAAARNSDENTLEKLLSDTVKIISSDNILEGKIQALNLISQASSEKLSPRECSFQFGKGTASVKSSDYSNEGYFVAIEENFSLKLQDEACVITKIVRTKKLFTMPCTYD